jgi:hypothetical protein
VVVDALGQVVQAGAVLPAAGLKRRRPSAFDDPNIGLADTELEEWKEWLDELDADLPTTMRRPVSVVDVIHRTVDGENKHLNSLVRLQNDYGAIMNRLISEATKMVALVVPLQEARWTYRDYKAKREAAAVAEDKAARVALLNEEMAELKRKAADLLRAP